MTPEEISEQLSLARLLEFQEDRYFVALADLVERHLEAIRKVYEQERGGQEPDIATIEALDAAEVELKRAVRR